MGSKLDCQEVWSSYLPGPDRVKDNVLSAPVFLEPCFAPAPYQKKKEWHSHIAPFEKREWHSLIALS